MAKVLPVVPSMLDGPDTKAAPSIDFATSTPATARAPARTPPAPTPPTAVAPRAGLHQTAVHLVRQRLRELLERVGWYDSEAAMMLRKVLRGQIFGVLMIVALILALFLGEIFALAQVAGNLALDLLLTLVFLVFAAEFIGLVITDASYLFSFFFWMDLIGTGSMVLDISYMAGTSATEPVEVHSSGGVAQENVLVVRAARAAKLGARAGRISRVLKILRFLPFLFQRDQDVHRAKMARVISNQLTNVLSTRVAFLTICIVVVTPLFTMFTYPEIDDSMAAWAELLGLLAEGCENEANATDAALQQARLQTEVSSFISFYSDNSYGPFQVMYGETTGDVFTAKPEVMNFTGHAFGFDKPRRLSSSRIVSSGPIQASFNLAEPFKVEALANIGLIGFVILVMCSFGLVMSSSISVIALQPLERMLSTVRARCKEIFKYTVDMQDDTEGDEDEDYDDMEQSSEFVLLEKVVVKLTDILKIAALKHGPEVKENMTNDEIMQLNWMQGNINALSRATLARGSGKRVIDAESEIDPPLDTSLCSLPPSLLEWLNTDNFDTLSLNPQTQGAVAVYITNTVEGCSDFVRSSVKQTHLVKFCSQAEAGYLKNPFHNFAHALDVAYSLRRWLSLIQAHRFISDLQQFAMAIAGLGHDLGHLALNNQYLIETSHELAVKYNDVSPLENMHCSKLFQIANEAEANVFSEVDKDAYKLLRRCIIEAILHTDVTKHNEMVKECGMLYQMNSDAFDQREGAPVISASATTTQLMINILVHGADVGNPMKPWDLCQRIAHLCMDEFFAQGDLEKEAGMTVQMLNDREKVNRPNSQIGFIEFLIAPMVVTMVNLFPPLHELAGHLGTNIARWADTWERETQPTQDAKQKVTVRVDKVVANLKAASARGG